ncbi:hypothetical protein [Nocardia sp. NPDC052566]|uniref:hypothetical protein n=1 Tax=Nocardia sp. NPDC052566 TaxID=3364330 RepID=UPI0037C9D6BB
MAHRLSRNSIRTIFGTVAVGAALVVGGATASAAPLTLDPAPATAPAATSQAVADGTGSASGSARPGSIFCWLLNPSPACQI